jgi:hypothetical protein
MSLIAFAVQDHPETFSTAKQPHGLLVCLLGETVQLRSDGHPITSIEPVAVPEGEAAAVVEDVPITITPAELGRHHYRARTLDGVDYDVTLVACDPACIEWIEALPSPNPHSQSASPRQILTALARNDQGFTGRVEQLHNKPLANYGL